MLLLRNRIERFLRRSRMAPTRFGREAVRDPRFVLDLRLGRHPRPRVAARVRAYLDEQEALLKRKRARWGGRPQAGDQE